jgi:uncharacterized delta-60 repeat protein
MKKTLSLWMFLLIFISAPALAQSGNVDSTFGTNGIVISNQGSWAMLGRDIIQQSNGKIIVCGGGNNMIILARYNADGTLDPAFGTGGFANSSPFVLSGIRIAEQKDGKIIAVGTVGSGTSTMFAIYRFDSLGVTDLSFGSNGFLTVNFNTALNVADTPWALAIDDNDVIYVAGQTSNGIDNDFAITKVINGALVPSFGSNGVAIFDFGSGNDVATGIGFLPNGNIVVGGRSFNGANNDFALLSIDTNGVLDPAFGNGGKIRADYGNVNNFSDALAVTENGLILLAGGSNNSTDVALARFLSNGTLDSSFGNGGFVLTNCTGSESAADIALQKDGKIILCGETGNGANYRFLVLRYTADGFLDNSFSQNGWATVDAPNNGDNYFGEGVVVLDNGKIAVAGYKNIGFTYEFAVAQLENAVAYFNVYPDTIPLHWIATNEASGTPPMSYVWSWGDGNTSTGATPSHTYSSPGFYNICLTVTDANNCVSTYCDSSTYIFHATSGNAVIYISVVQGPLTVGMNETLTEKRVRIFPNPTSSLLTIRNVSSPVVEIFNLLGQQLDGVEMINLQNEEMSLDVSKLKSGIYLLRIDGQMVRFVRQ